MRKLGWIRPLTRFPAIYWRPDLPYPTSLPARFFLPCDHLAATDMGDEPASSIHAIIAAIDLLANRTSVSERILPSASFIRRSMYYEESSYQYEISNSLTDTIRHIQRYGWVSEYDAPYIPGAELAPNDDDCTEFARGNIGSQFGNISLSVHVFKLALSSGFPIVFGTALAEGWDDPLAARQGRILSPQPGVWPISGCALTIVGWDDPTARFRIRSPFGALWGDNGYGWIDFAAVMNQSISDDHYVCLNP